MIRDLDRPCDIDGCGIGPIGDHTLRQWDAHLETPSHALDYEDDPLARTEQMVRQAGLPEGTILADTITARAAGFLAETGPARIVVPILLLDLNLGRAGLPPKHTGDAAIMASPDLLRRMGTMLRDTAFGAAKAAEIHR